MPSVWIATRRTRAGKPRYRVEYRLGGRSTKVRYAGSFKTKREAKVRMGVVAGDLAAQRVPTPGAIVEPAAGPTLGQAAAAWQASRVDVSENTRLQHRSAVRRIPAALLARPIESVTPQDIAAVVATLDAAGKKRETIRKTTTALAMIFDHAGITPNPARNRVVVKLPREDRIEPDPPDAEHVIAVFYLLPPRHRLPLLWLDYSGARVGSIDETLVSDYDEPRRRIRLRAAVMKSRRGLWVDLPDALSEAIEELIGPREDRDPDARIFAPSGSAALRTSIGKACRAAGVPSFSPHDFRHRRISLNHRRGDDWATIGAFVGQIDLAVTANIYTHANIDGVELDYAELLEWARKHSRGATPRATPV